MDLERWMVHFNNKGLFDCKQMNRVVLVTKLRFYTYFITYDVIMANSALRVSVAGYLLGSFSNDDGDGKENGT